VIENVNQLNYWYVREIGEEVRARLFPTPKRELLPDGTLVEGVTPEPRPILLEYIPYGEEDPYEVLFLQDRTVQLMGGDLSFEGGEIPASCIRIFWEGVTLLRDLTFGAEPTPANADEIGSEREVDALNALLKAVAGTA
jgi:hypothetical protein